MKKENFPRLQKVFPNMRPTGAETNKKDKSKSFERFTRIAELTIKVKEIKQGKSFLKISEKRREGEVSDFLRATGKKR